MRRPIWQLPHWLDRIVCVGIVSNDPEVRRGQMFVNVAAIAAAIDAIFHVFYDASQGQSDLAVMHVHNLLLAGLFITVPLTHRLGDVAAALYLVAIVLTSVTFVLWAVGLESGGQVYFTILPVIFICFGPRHWRWFAALLAVDYILLLLALEYAPAVGSLAPGDAAWRHRVAGQVLIGALTVNALLIVYALTSLRRTEEALKTANAQSDSLLSTLLPERIAAQLKASPSRAIAERVDRVTILFVDIVGFTGAVRDLPPDQVVAYLDRLYTLFDGLAATHGVEKIKTMGDGYMAAGGLDGDADAGMSGTACLALAIMAAVAEQPRLGDRELVVRAGLHVGPATAGVIGARRFSYDVWGDAVNTAARLEQAAAPGTVLASQVLAQQLAGEFEFAPPASTLVRGIGSVTTAVLLGPSPGADG